MPWKETCPMEERLRFVTAFDEQHDATVAELCRAFGVSRRTGYKWLERRRLEGLEGLKDRSRAPIRRPQTIPPGMVDLLLEIRRRYPKWGPRKLLEILRGQHPGVRFPAPSSYGELLKRHGMVKSRRVRERMVPFSQPFHECTGPNCVWCVDFKGHFALGNRARCHPLTITDAFSRMILHCQGFPNERGPEVQRAFERTFREYGLPEAIRSDNGPPFASMKSMGGLTRLSIWWIKLGIRPERIAPGRPDQNGRHERMHRTLKEETTQPPKEDMAAQQLRFDLFRREFNEVRPHEALGQKPPASVHRPSPRPYPLRLPEITYPPGYLERRVEKSGMVAWGSRRSVYFSAGQLLAGESVGMRQIDDCRWLVRFGCYPLGLFDESKRGLVELEPPEAEQ